MTMKQSSTSFRLPDASVTLTLEQEWVDVRTEIQPMKIDPDWAWTDPSGHKHDASLKNTHWVVLYTYYCEMCWDEHDVSELVCRYCGVEVKPHRVPDYDQPDRIPGLVTAKLEVERAGVFSEYIVPSGLLEEFAKADDENERAAWVARVENDDYLIARTVTSHGLSA